MGQGAGGGARGAGNRAARGDPLPRESRPKETLARLFDAMACVRERKHRGGAAPERVAQHIAAARKNLADDRAHVVALVAKVDAARGRLESAFALVREKAGA